MDKGLRLADGEMELVRRLAKAEDLSVGEYVRPVLRAVGQRVPTRSVAAKLASIREAVRHSFLTGSIVELN